MTSSLLDVRRGSQTPRVANFPAYPTTAAPEAIDLAASVGLHLDEWQQYVLTHGMGQTPAGDWTAKKVSVWVPRQNGKGAVIEALELYWLFVTCEKLIVHSAHQHRTSQKAYERLEGLIRRAPHLHRQVRQYRQANGEQQIELYDGRMLQYTTRSRTAVRGFSAPKVVLDEAQELTAEQIAALMPTLSAMENWQAWFLGTPPDDPAAWCYALKADGEAGAARLAHMDWGLDGDPDDPAERPRILDPANWYRTNPTLGDRIQHETVEDESKPSGLGVKFGAERLGMWKPPAAGGVKVIADELWRDLTVTAERPADVAMAIVVNHKRTHTAIASVGPRFDGRLQASIVAYQPGTHWVVGKAVDLRERWNPVGFAVQDKGPSGTLVDPLEAVGIVRSSDPDEPRRGDLAVPWSNDVGIAFGLTIDALDERRLVHVDDAPLNAAAAVAATRPLGGGSTWDYKTDGAELLQAVSLALWLYVTRAAAVAVARDEIGIL